MTQPFPEIKSTIKKQIFAATKKHSMKALRGINYLEGSLMNLVRMAQIYFRIAALLEGHRDDQVDRDILGAPLHSYHSPLFQGKIT